MDEEKGVMKFIQSSKLVKWIAIIKVATSCTLSVILILMAFVSSSALNTMKKTISNENSSDFGKLFE